MKKMSKIKKFGNKGILLSIIILFSISIILIPSSVYAQEINVKSIGVEKTSIITFTNDGTKDIKTQQRNQILRNFKKRRNKKMRNTKLKWSLK